MNDYINYILEQTQNVLAIDSPTGFTSRAAAYVMNEYKKLGYSPCLTNKGGILVCVSEGTPNQDAGPIMLQAHMDTLAPWSAISARTAGFC